MRVHIGGAEAGFPCARSDDSGAGDVDGGDGGGEGIGGGCLGAAGGRGEVAIHGVGNRRAGGGAGDGERERRVVKAAVHVKDGVFAKGRDAGGFRAIGHPGGVVFKEDGGEGTVVGGIAVADGLALIGIRRSGHRTGGGHSELAHHRPASAAVGLTEQDIAAVVEVEGGVWLDVGDIPLEAAAINEPVAVRGDARMHGRWQDRRGEDPLAGDERIIAERPAGERDGSRAVVVQFDPARAVEVHVELGIRVIGTPGIVHHEFIDLNGGGSVVQTGHEGAAGERDGTKEAGGHREEEAGGGRAGSSGFTRHRRPGSIPECSKVK